MDRTSEKTQTERVWKSLAEAGLVKVSLDEFLERIKDAKHVAIGRLGELLKLENGIQERESVAHSLGTLKRLETTLRESTYLPAVAPSKPSDE